MTLEPRVPVVGDRVRVDAPFGAPYYGVIVDRRSQSTTEDLYAVAFDDEPGLPEFYKPHEFTVMTRRAAA